MMRLTPLEETVAGQEIILIIRKYGNILFCSLVSGVRNKRNTRNKDLIAGVNIFRENRRNLSG